MQSMISIFCSFPLLSSLVASCLAPTPLAVGYVEGSYVLVAPIEVSHIMSVEVERGDRFAAGQPLVQLERQDREIAVAEAEAVLARAESQLADLHTGKRPQEIAAIEATLSSARAQEQEAKRNVQRQSDLLRRGAVAQATYDATATDLAQAQSKVLELEAQLALAKLPARPEAIKAAEASLRQAEASLRYMRWLLEQRTLSISKPGTIFDVTRNPGELAGPQAPVLSVLPDGAVKLRVYVPEAALPSVSIGTVLSVDCDGCGTGITATVSYVASNPEFTPPVIYSLQNRQKLVYLVEAVPGTDATALKPGQIVDVNLGMSNDERH